MLESLTHVGWFFHSRGARESGRKKEKGEGREEEEELTKERETEEEDERGRKN